MLEKYKKRVTDDEVTAIKLLTIFLVIPVFILSGDILRGLFFSALIVLFSVALLIMFYYSHGGKP